MGERGDADGILQLAAGWRLPSVGLEADVNRAASQPIVMVTLPVPAGPNESYYLCAVPSVARQDGARIVQCNRMDLTCSDKMPCESRP